MNILGLSAYYHDSAAVLLRDGVLIAAAQEERFSRKKHDAGFPENAIKSCLAIGDIKLDDIDEIVFYDKPFVKFERLLETYLSYAPKGFCSFILAMPVWLKEKLFLKTTLKKRLAALGGVKIKDLPRLLFSEHHHSHAASAFFPSPYHKAAILCLDGVGEWATTSVWLGKGNTLTPLWEMNFPHSLGLLYSAFTYYLGFKVNSGEYKLMGLAPYGEPKYVSIICDNLLDIKDDGTFRLNMEYFNFSVGLTMTNDKFSRLFDLEVRTPETEITQKHMDIASSIQKVTENIVLRLACTIYKEMDVEYLCMAGGVALNCVSNSRVLHESPFKDVWIQPAAGDAGGALGAAMTVWHEFHKNPREIKLPDSMQGAYLGPSYSDADISRQLDAMGAVYEKIDDSAAPQVLSKILAEENVLGWFQGRMEFGPRALGARSILADPGSDKMQTILNAKIKYRESFRPFAPAVPEEDVSKYFEINRECPYMLFTSPVKKSLRVPICEEQKKLSGIDKLNIRRSKLPAITHIDYSARVQTVNKKINPRFHAVLKNFEKQSGYPVLVNTSFNVRGEPVVCTPTDAYSCFIRTEMDYLYIGNYLLHRNEQPYKRKEERMSKEQKLD